MKITKKNPRHALSYFTLLDTLDTGACPICSLVDRESKNHLHALYYEFVNDAGVRDTLHRSRGFCNWHAWTSTEIPCSGTGISIIYNDLLQSEIAAMRQILSILETPSFPHPPQSRRRRKKDLDLAIRDWKKRDTCLVCASNARATLFHLRELLDFLGEAPFLEKYRASPGLCLPHLKICIENFRDHPNLSVAVGIALEKARYLSWELGEFWRKHDYRFSEEPKGSEIDSWLRAIRWFTGARELFPNDIVRALLPATWEAVPSRCWHVARRFLDKVRAWKIRPSPSPSKKPPPLHPVALDVIRAMKKEGCPVCRAGDKALADYFTWLTKQNYDTPSILAEIQEAGGFCRTHAARLRELAPDYMGTVLLESLISNALGTLDTFARSLDTASGPGGASRRLAVSRRILVGNHDCPACRVVRRAERDAGRQLIALLAGENETARDRYKASDGLCLRHLTPILREAPAKTAGFLARDMVRRLSPLRKRLRDFLKHADYREKNARRAGERAAWREGLMRVSGFPDREE